MDNWNSNKLPERLPFSKKRLSKRVIFSYILDYVIIVALIATFYIIDKVEPFHQHFALENYTLHYPFAEHERIPVFQLVLICAAAPAAIIAFYTLVIDGLFSHQTPMASNATGVRRLAGRYRLKDRLWELNCGILGLFLSVGFAFTITGALKNAIGKPRPDLIDRCKLDPKKTDELLASIGAKFSDKKFLLATIDMCTQKDHAILQDGFKSFPSGHSSTAFAGLFYLSLYLAAKLHILDSKGEVWKGFVVLIPSLGAALVAGSRIMDARHHPFDVLSGSLMGILVAWASYRQYFPPVSETWKKGRAYPIRAWGKQTPAPNPTFRADDVVPLTRARTDTDLERGDTSGFSAQTAVAGAAEPGSNVFRQQISQSQSQRQRQGDPRFNVHHSETMDSSLSTKVNRYQGQLPAANPFAGDDPRLRHENYDYSSSDEDENYELQQTHTLAAPYNPVAGQFTDTGYHPPIGISPAPTPPPPANLGTAPVSHPLPPTGDLGDSRRQVPPGAPAHAF
ncbi:lipid phosphate phosphatase-like protein 1 [Amniculicola lignicola CBS 123094]|uniref:Lipid phosphate phosphatase-like protein 1 n=1 Tax=Amniculicola lignicola CBS 123094 TaxID=1392246 RepID=A0A6A5X1U3_9PLEO|nr:lipid phosphate phosphatase-like protein 1 [Amniculicola lignicola CBS 123094]